MGSLFLIGFGLLLGHSLAGSSFSLTVSETHHPPHLVCCCTGALAPGQGYWCRLESPEKILGLVSLGRYIEDSHLDPSAE